MKLQEAIKVTTALAKHGYWTMTPTNFDAIKLVTEAGKRLQKSRSVGQFMDMPLLPGETAE